MSLHQINRQEPEGLNPIGSIMPRALQTVERAVVANRGADDLVVFRAASEGWLVPAQSAPRRVMLAKALELLNLKVTQHYGKDGWGFVRDCAAAATGFDDLLDPARGVTGWGGGIDADRAMLTLLAWDLHEIKPSHAEPGDVLLFDMGEGVHPAILTSPGGSLTFALNTVRNAPTAPKMAHVYWARGLIEAWIGPDVWMPRLIGAFSFVAPGAPQRAALKAAA